jgi:hypothetical protein
VERFLGRGDQLAFHTPTNNKFTYIQKWITKKNILEITDEAKKHLKIDEIDVISLDLDGNDIHFVRELLNHQVHPKLFIVEYNAKFIPPVEFEILYDEGHIWRGDDYFGASLASFVKLFEEFNYRLICCNSGTGANAFFIQNIYLQFFTDVPEDILNLYSPPRYNLPQSYGHPQSIKTLEALFHKD